MSTINRVKFGSKLGVILATAGSAVGLGNIWRFPYITGENGGGAFIIIYILCVLLLGIPCMISEFIIGRRGASNTARAYEKLAGGSIWKWIGFMGVVTGFLITSYYAIVSGWCFHYIYAAISGNLDGSPEEIQQYFINFETNAWQPILWGIFILMATHLIIIQGIKKGIERASKILMPTLFLLLILIIAASCMLPNAEKGLQFLFKPDFSNLNGEVILNALGQAFFSLSIGMGCLCTYASYFNRQTNLLKSAIQISIIDCCVAILAGVMIFPAAFSIGISPDSGASLVFITLPNVFLQVFAPYPTLGIVISIAFYALLTLAALTSLISLHELCTAFLHEEFHIPRRRAALMVTITATLIGALCSLSLGDWHFLSIAGISLFDSFDFVTSQILLPLGGLLTCLFLGWYVPKRILKEEFTNHGMLRGRLFKLYILSIKYLCPISIAAIFLHQFGIL